MPSLLPDDVEDEFAEKYRSLLAERGADLRLVSNRELIKRLGDSAKDSR